MSKIPFSWLPASWGLKGKSRAIAQAEYYLTGYDLDVELAKIEHGPDSAEFTKAVLAIDLRYGKISAYDRDIRLSEIEFTDDVALTLAKLAIDLKHNRISPQEHERKVADAKNEPYMAMPKISWDPKDPTQTYFELDYNEAFVEFLRGNGYAGTDEDCINRWLNDVCNSIIGEMGQADGDFVTNVRKVRRDDGTVEHS